MKIELRFFLEIFSRETFLTCEGMKFKVGGLLMTETGGGGGGVMVGVDPGILDGLGRERRGGNLERLGVDMGVCVKNSFAKTLL